MSEYLTKRKELFEQLLAGIRKYFPGQFERCPLLAAVRGHIEEVLTLETIMATNRGGGAFEMINFYVLDASQRERALGADTARTVFDLRGFEAGSRGTLVCSPVYRDGLDCEIQCPIRMEDDYHFWRIPLTVTGLADVANEERG